MNSYPDGEYKYIAHAKDHFTRFSWATALKSKEAIYVANFLFQTFMQFGAPAILQSDNGKEFANQVIRDLIGMWPGTHIIRGRPRYPQSQGSVERANRTIKDKLSVRVEDNNREDWSTGLPFVICKYYYYV